MVDRILALLLILFLSPLILIVALGQLVSFNQIFFTQQRIGKNERPFRLIKFISMKSKTEDIIGVQSSWGRFIRNYSIDEIPQLINIILGEMAFIGPRPLLPEYLEFYSKDQRLRHSVKPGLTGWAQVNGRNDLTWNQQFELDIFFVKNRTLKMKLIIIFRSVNKVLSPKKGDIIIRKRFNGKN